MFESVKLTSPSANDERQGVTICHASCGTCPMLSRMRVGILRGKRHVLAACDGLVRGRVDGHGVME